MDPKPAEALSVGGPVVVAEEAAEEEEEAGGLNVDTVE